MNLNDLKKPFPPEAVHWRVGSVTKDKSRGMAVAYIDARDVMDRLDEVCGPEWWGTHFEEVGGRIICTIAIRVPMRVPHPLGPDVGSERIEYGWVKKSDGAGNTDFEPEKGGLSDAFKRAAVQWGIGRYLYDVDATWVDLDGEGKRIKPSEMPKLRRLLQAPTVPQDARGAIGGSETPANVPAEAGGASKPGCGKRPIKTPADFEAAVARARSEDDTAILDHILMGWIERDMHGEAERKRLGRLLQSRIVEVRMT